MPIGAVDLEPTPTRNARGDAAATRDERPMAAGDAGHRAEIRRGRLDASPPALRRPIPLGDRVLPRLWMSLHEFPVQRKQNGTAPVVD